MSSDTTSAISFQDFVTTGSAVVFTPSMTTVIVDAAAGADHDVPRLDVPMHQAHVVRLLEGVADLPQKGHRPTRRDRAVPGDHVLQGQP